MTAYSRSSFSFQTGVDTVLPIERASIFFDGEASMPRLQHPEGVAIGPDGAIWCSSENGQILRISQDGSQIEEVASTGGFTLGLAFDGDRALYACDVRHSAVFKLDLQTEELTRFSSLGIKIPNFPVVDRKHNRLLVSDSYESGVAGPGVWAFDLDTGKGGLWYDEPLMFANGLAVDPSGAWLYVCETFRPAVLRIELLPDGSAGRTETFVEGLPGLPDGLAFDEDGALYIGCYEPSRILRVSSSGDKVEVYLEDVGAHTLCHPTNIAFDGNQLFIANLGRWHITSVETDVSVRPLLEWFNEPVR